MDLAALLAMLENLDQLSDAELAELEADLAAAVEALLDGDVSDDALQDAQRAAEGVEAVRAAIDARTEAAANRAAEAQALLDRVRGVAEDAADDEGGDDGEPEVVTPDEVIVAEDEEPVAVAASTPARRPTTRVGRVAARQHPDARLGLGDRRPEPPSLSFPDWGLTASANAPGVSAGSPVRDYEQLAQVFFQGWRALSGPQHGPRTSVPLVRAGRGAVEEYGEARTLDGNARANASKIRAVTHPQAITAAGGMCAPINISYDLPVLGSTARPVRDSLLARFGADRGGIRTLIPPVLADVTGAIGFWTDADDIAAASNDGTDDTVKPCITIECPDETESLVYAVTRCFRTGNFRQRFFPEQIEAVMRLVAVAHARAAEVRLLQEVAASSTAVTAGRLLGTSRDLLAHLDVAVAAYRDRWRLDEADRLRFAAPRWLREQLRTDIARSLPGTTDENLAMADARIATFITSRNVNLTWLLDGATADQHFDAQGAGPLVAYPDTAVTYLFPEGAHLFLDGGTLDLGLVRDSTLNSVNDVMWFAETFEGHHYQGPESLQITMTLCPDGTVSGTADIDPCAAG